MNNLLTIKLCMNYGKLKSIYRRISRMNNIFREIDNNKKNLSQHIHFLHRQVINK